MSATTYSPTDTHHEFLHKLLKNPHDADLLKEARQRLRSDCRGFSNAVNEHVTSLAPKPAPEPPTKAPKKDKEEKRLEWSNVLGEQTCYPKAILKPAGLADLKAAVSEARANGWTARAVGSGHSFSDDWTTDGVLVDPHEMKRVLGVDRTVLKDPAGASGLFAVESGITIHDLNIELDKAGVALANMGAFDGQTLAGAISTGTHGTGITLGPIAASVRAVTLVAEDATVYQIEPTDGITDAGKWKSPDGIVLKQDDDWFNAACVAMGCLGLIYSYTIAVLPSYFLTETRTASTWETLKSAGFAGTPLPKLPFAYRHFEIDINPYPTQGAHHAIVVQRNIPPPSPSPITPSGTRGPGDFFAGLLAESDFIEDALIFLLNTFPSLSPTIITTALGALEDKDFVQKSFVVMDLGKVDDVSAYALELSLPADDDSWIGAVDAILAIFGEEKMKDLAYMAGPVALRFVAPAAALLAPQQGRKTMMVELDMLNGINNGKKLLTAVKQAVTALPGLGSRVRVHWGLDLDTVTAAEAKDPQRWPMWATWEKVYRQLNTTGMWNNRFTNRMGISTVKK